MRCKYHIERDFATIPMNFLFLEYHQIRFVSFGIWFLGLFLTDFTSIVTTPGDQGWNDVIEYIKVISIIHAIFLVLFLIYLLFRQITDHEEPTVTVKMIIQSLFDMSIHLDIASIIFSFFFLDHKKNAMFIPEVLVFIDAVLTIVLTPFKKWRAAIDIFGVLPTLILAHISLYRTVNFVLVFVPISVILISPFIFTVISIGAFKEISRALKKFIKFIDPSLLPNQMLGPVLPNPTVDDSMINASLTQRPSTENQLTFLDNINKNNQTSPQITHRERRERDRSNMNLQEQTRSGEARNQDLPPSIHDRATTGSDDDYVDFKSIPAAILATFFIHFGCFCQGAHTYTMIVMAHYFITLAITLINTRVVAFPAIVLTNVTDKNVQFNSVWPELSFV